MKIGPGKFNEKMGNAKYHKKKQRNYLDKDEK